MEPIFKEDYQPDNDVRLPEAIPLQNSVLYQAENRTVRKNRLSSFSNKRTMLLGTFALLSLLLLFVAGWMFASLQKPKNVSSSVTSYQSTDIPLDNLEKDNIYLDLGQLSQVQINGKMTINGSLVLKPSDAPNNPKAGELYIDSSSKSLYFYSGNEYKKVSVNTDTVSSIGGQSGTIGIGSNLIIRNGVLSALSSNTGSTTIVQQQTGIIAPVAGSGIVVDGTTISNNGVLNIGGLTGSINVGRGLLRMRVVLVTLCRYILVVPRLM